MFAYEQGFKRCIHCNKQRIITERSHCPDCGYKLRTKPRRRYEKQKVYCIGCKDTVVREVYVKGYWQKQGKEKHEKDKAAEVLEDAQLYYVLPNGMLGEAVEGEYDKDTLQRSLRARLAYKLCVKCRDKIKKKKSCCCC